jgi:hypothetical protein
MAGDSGMRMARLAGCLLGVILAGTLVLASRPASGGGAVGAEVSVYANPTGELAVDPTGPSAFLTVSALRPGGSASGSFRTTNQTDRTQRIWLGARPASHELDGWLEVQMSADSRMLASGPLGRTAAAAEPLVLASGESATINVTLRLSADAGPKALLALEDIVVTFWLEAKGGAGG